MDTQNTETDLELQNKIINPDVESSILLELTKEDNVEQGRYNNDRYVI